MIFFRAIHAITCYSRPPPRTFTYGCHEQTISSSLKIKNKKSWKDAVGSQDSKVVSFRLIRTLSVSAFLILFHPGRWPTSHRVKGPKRCCTKNSLKHYSYSNDLGNLLACQFLDWEYDFKVTDALELLDSWLLSLKSGNSIGMAGYPVCHFLGSSIINHWHRRKAYHTQGIEGPGWRQLCVY